MNRERRIEALEVAYHRRQLLQAMRDAGPGITTEMLLEKAIAWMQMPRAQQRANMPGLTEGEIDEMTSLLPIYRRMLIW